MILRPPPVYCDAPSNSCEYTFSTRRFRRKNQTLCPQSRGAISETNKSCARASCSLVLVVALVENGCFLFFFLSCLCSSLSRARSASIPQHGKPFQEKKKQQQQQQQVIPIRFFFFFFFCWLAPSSLFTMVL